MSALQQKRTKLDQTFTFMSYIRMPAIQKNYRLPNIVTKPLTPEPLSLGLVFTHKSGRWTQGVFESLRWPCFTPTPLPLSPAMGEHPGPVRV